MAIVAPIHSRKKSDLMEGHYYVHGNDGASGGQDRWPKLSVQ
jgi:hypothetical protein